MRRGESSSAATTRCPPSRSSPARTTARTRPQRSPPRGRPASTTTAIALALRTFPGVEHRIEEVATIAGVRYVNDSKATNVAAALRALASFPGARKLVILGGRGKAEPYAPLAEAFAPGDRAYLIGEATEAIAAALDAADVPFERSGDLAAAVAAASLDAREGDVVLLSPACASFDQFTSFEHRGEEFGKLVQKLTG